MIDPILERLRAICMALPEANEQLFGGHTHPTFRVRDRIFVMYMNDHHDDGRVALWCKAPPGAQQVLVGARPERFFVPPYLGHRGWVGAHLDQAVDWEEMAGLVVDSYCLTAPKRLAARLTAGNA